jgi:hypothetical protein
MLGRLGGGTESVEAAGVTSRMWRGQEKLDLEFNDALNYYYRCCPEYFAS